MAVANAVDLPRLGQDPLTFQDGRFEFVWRNGESPGPGLTCRPKGRATDKGANTVVDSYSWVYTWSEPDGAGE